MSEKEPKLTQLDKAVKYTGLFLIVVMLLAHIFYKDIELTLLLIPALMIGLDINQLFRK